MPARGGKHFDDPSYVRFWETVQDLDMPIGFHVVVRDNPTFKHWLHLDKRDRLFGFAFLAIDVMAAFTAYQSILRHEKNLLAHHGRSGRKSDRRSVERFFS